ncbi:hypothetical protein PJL18_04114 [Paenarthrobacter nicotinovorans]|nr:hypothetical protein [Paenarthrobacter nicotinovorans]
MITCLAVVQLYAAPAARLLNRQLGAEGGRKPESKVPETGTELAVTLAVLLTLNE